MLAGITIHVDGGVSGNFRVLCDAEHDDGQAEVEEEALEAIATRWLPAREGPLRHPHEQ